MTTLLQTKLLARVAREHNLATKHYRSAFECYAIGKRSTADKERRLARHHVLKARSLEHDLIPGIHFDDDVKVCAQPTGRPMS
ncbi:hypothetical protein [uncultured Methylobacterium sp.]|uniref:hypothetical protein n=1 Tax=uncultured Methylobacterium sp. TaxID=157278 RepID=UPI0035CA8C91